MKKNLFTLIAMVACTLNVNVSSAQGVNFNILKATPIGSWQLRDYLETSEKGVQSGNTARSSMVGTETRNGETHYWIEMVINSFTINKNGDRKPEGDQMIVKSLVPASLMTSDPANIMGNLRGVGVETIVQSGNSDPMRMSNSGGMMDAMMKSMQFEINYNFEELGSESVSVPAGNFNATKIHGSGATEAKILFKTIRVESDSNVWMSGDVPFGTVKMEGSSTTDGKTSTFVSSLQEFGQSGAVSLITKTPQEMPSLKGLFNR